MCVFGQIYLHLHDHPLADSEQDSHLDTGRTACRLPGDGSPVRHLSLWGWLTCLSAVSLGMAHLSFVCQPSPWEGGGGGGWLTCLLSVSRLPGDGSPVFCLSPVSLWDGSPVFCLSSVSLWDGSPVFCLSSVSLWDGSPVFCLSAMFLGRCSRVLNLEHHD